MERAARVGREGGAGYARVLPVGQTGYDALAWAAGVGSHGIGPADADAFMATVGGDGGWALLTLHRAALAANARGLLATVRAVIEGCAANGLRLVWATHPRVAQDPRHAEALALVRHAGRVVDPIGYRAMARLLLHPGLASARPAAVFTDSGGLAEEAALAGVPLLVLRPSTERAELLAAYPERCRIAWPGGMGVAPAVAATLRVGTERTPTEALAGNPYILDGRSPSRMAAQAIVDYLSNGYGMRE